MTEPSSQDLANAATRQAIAERQNAEFREAQLLALGTLGPSYRPWMKLVLIDADHRRTGNRQPVATVFKVYRGEEKLTEHSRFIRRMPDGTVKHADNYEELFGELLTEKHPTLTVEVRGEQVPVDRYELCWSALELYHPRSAESLATAREKREARAVEKEAEDNPLFAAQIRSGVLKPEKNPRRR
jgi:hypothetical protein